MQSPLSIIQCFFIILSFFSIAVKRSFQIPANEGGYGKPLGNKHGNGLTSLCKIKLRKEGIRVVYALVRTEMVRMGEKPSKSRSMSMMKLPFHVPSRFPVAIYQSSNFFFWGLTFNS